MARILQKSLFYYEDTSDVKSIKHIGSLPKSLSGTFEEALKQYKRQEEGEFAFGFGTTNLHHVFYVLVQTDETPVLVVGKLDSFYEFKPREILLSLLTMAKDYFREQDSMITILIPPIFEGEPQLLDQPVCAFLEALIKKTDLILQSLEQIENLVFYFTNQDHVPLLHVTGVGLSFNFPYIAKQLEWVSTTLGVVSQNKRCSEYISTITSLNRLIEAQPSITKLALLNLSQALLLLYLGKRTGFSKLGEERISLSLNVIKKQATTPLIPALIALMQEFFEKALVEGDKIPYYFGQTIVELAVKGQMLEEIRLINAEYAGVLQKDLTIDLKQLYFEAIIDNSLLISITDTLSALQTTWELFKGNPRLQEIYLNKLNEALGLLPESPELYQNLVELFLTVGNYEQAIEAKIKGFEYEIIQKGLNLDDVIDLLQWGMQLKVEDQKLKMRVLEQGLIKFFDKHFEINQLISIYSHVINLAKESLKHDIFVEFVKETIKQASMRMVQDQFLVFKFLDDYLSNEDTDYYEIILDIRLRSFKVALMTNNIPEASHASVSLLNAINLELEDAESTFQRIIIEMLEFSLLYAQHEITTDLLNRALSIIQEQGFKVQIGSLVHQALKRIVMNYGYDGLYAPYVTSFIKEVIQNPEVQSTPYIYEELLEIGLQVNFSDRNPQAYYELFTLLQAFKLRENPQDFIDFVVKGLEELLSINGENQAKQIIHEISDGILEAETLQAFYRKLLDLPENFVQKLLTPTEVAQIRRELAKLQSRVLDNEEGLEHYIKGVRELQERKEYELVRDMAIEGIKYAIEKNAREKLPLFLKPLQESFQINFNTYSKIKSDPIYFDLIKDLRELTQLLHKQPEYKILLEIILELARIERTIAKKESNPKSTVLHCYRGISILKEFLLTTTTLGVKISDAIQEQIWNEVKILYVLIIDKQRYNLSVLPRFLAQFIVSTKMYYALPHYYGEFALSQQIIPKLVFKPKSLENLLSVYEGMLILLPIVSNNEKADVELYKSALIKLFTQINSKLHNPVTSTKVSQLTALLKTQPKGDLSIRMEQFMELRDTLVTEILKS